MAIQTSAGFSAEFIDYPADGILCEAYVVYDGSTAAKRPCVVVAHDWSGQNDSIRTATEPFVSFGYLGFALDVYGKGVRGGETDNNSALMAPLMQDRALLRRRLLAAVAAAKRHPLVDPDRIAVVGYCFGGLCALDVARSATPDVPGVVSIHGVLQPPRIGVQAPIRAKVLILHGWEDPMAPPADVLAVAQELTEAGADWQIHAYGHAMHSFSWSLANLPEVGIAYNATAHQRSTIALQKFLEEIFEAERS
ncbi:dienelactone hydrolase family protein [Gloeobacter morelensis]|uniref:Dienelactone hydrolase family protein n=1 Tax=Gloeobacter morelensis MG652769 TaxID=2781736 RepID=A0ABY3PI81_9CYAN|nr:dienelactone hydrolase family protein [Gloeobacter morelensis]UFP93390.1 dienelactone hydrolase family protein [Gloeobacter morelensis MG652769]